MNFYLSSYKFGDALEPLRAMVPANKRLGHINNARDFVGRDPKRAAWNLSTELEFLNEIGFEAEELDLKEYFGRKEELKAKLDSLGGLWVSGGNAFVLRQAMRLSGFDELFPALRQRKGFFYGGYSAGICILSHDLKAIDYVDDVQNFPYEGISKPIYEALGVFDYYFMPHYDSDHPESEMIGREVQRCIDQKWLFKALRDGEVILVEEDE